MIYPPIGQPMGGTSDSLDETSTIRMDYSATGLSDRAVCLENLDSVDTVSLSKYSANEPVFAAEYVTVNYYAK